MRSDKAKLIIINYRIYSSDFAERCKKALESSFGEVPLPECLTNKKKTSRIKI